MADGDSSSDSESSPWKWYHWLALSVGAVISIAAGTILLAGVAGVMSSATLVGSIALGAAQGALVNAGIGIITGAIGGAIGAYISGATGLDIWNMVAQGAVMGFSIGAVTGAITGSIHGYNGWYQAMLKEFTHFGQTNEVVLGRIIVSYYEIAQGMKANYFYSERWQIVYDMFGVGDRGMWKLNRMFLDSRIAFGQTFTLVSQPVKFGFYGKELAYLMSLGKL